MQMRGVDITHCVFAVAMINRKHEIIGFYKSKF